MRKSVLAIVVVIGGIMAIAFWRGGRTGREKGNPTIEPAVPEQTLIGGQPAAGAPEAVPPPVPSSLPAPVRNDFFSSNVAAIELSGEGLTQKIAQVEALAEVNEPESLAALIAELRHPVRAVRAAAVRATVQLGERQAVPALRSLATNTVDSAERIQATEAADYLDLPSLREWRRNRRQAASGSKPVPPPTP